MAERIRFVIVSCPRTGSTHLVDYLASVPGICCLSELFRAGEVLLRHDRALDPRHLDLAARDADPLGWLDRLERDFGDCGWFGFKLFPGQQSSLLRFLCADPGWRKIYLWRDNILDQYLSYLLALRHFGTGEWGRVPADRRLAVPTGQVIADLAAIEQNYLAIEQILALAGSGNVFGLEYADLGRAAAMQELLEFLGLPAPAIAAATIDAPQRRFDRGPGAAHRIENYDEIRRLLQPTRYRRFLEP